MPFNVQCKRCANLHNDWCKLVVDSPDPELVRDCQYYRTLTNYDRIISKTPEELATLISENIDCGVCENVFGLRPCSERCCPDFWLDWLKQEVSDGT